MTLPLNLNFQMRMSTLLCVGTLLHYSIIRVMLPQKSIETYGKISNGGVPMGGLLTVVCLFTYPKHA